MKVLDFIKKNGVKTLTEEYGIVVKEYDDLLVLNYDQIESPKSEDIVSECRGLILDKQLSVVSRSFDRFFNYGERPETQQHLDFSKAVVYEKMDGSLIKIYNHKGFWNISTRGTAFAESGVNGFDLSFKDLVLKALCCEDDADFQEQCNACLDSQFTYIFEVTSVENRVVKRYTGYTLWYLASRHNTSGVYGDDFEEYQAQMFGALLPEKYEFSSVEECIETAKHLKDLSEGYVVYQDFVPVCKIKSPAYLAVHAIRGEGLTPKRIKQLVLINEQDEYLTYFPEDEQFFAPYVVAFDNMKEDLVSVFDNNSDIEDQKEFALVVKDYPYSAVLFQARQKKQNPVHVLHSMPESYKLKVIDSYMETIK